MAPSPVSWDILRANVFSRNPVEDIWNLFHAGGMLITSLHYAIILGGQFLLTTQRKRRGRSRPSPCRFQPLSQRLLRAIDLTGGDISGDAKEKPSFEGVQGLRLFLPPLARRLIASSTMLLKVLAS